MTRDAFVMTIAAVVLAAGTAVAQPPELPPQPVLGSVFTAALLRDLPTGNSPVAVLETIQLQTIGDGFTAGGLNITTPIRFGGYLNSWTQTQYRIGDVSITDPRTGGVPMLMPTVAPWARMTTITGDMAIDERAPGLSVTFDPLRPATTWVREVEGWASSSAFTSGADGSVPAIDRVSGMGDATALFSGPLTNRLGLVAQGTWRGLSHVSAASSPSTTSDYAGSVLAHLVFARREYEEIRGLVWFQGRSSETTSDTSVHLQSTWERRAPGRTTWRVFGGYTDHRRSADWPGTLVIDSRETDPVTDFLDAGDGTDRRWTLGARIAPGHARLPDVGLEIDSASLRTDPTAIGEIRESVDGQPSRLWTVTPGAGEDVRRSTTFAAFAGERLTFGPVTLDAGLRFEAMNASAEGAAQGIGWASVLPRVRGRWDISRWGSLAAIAGYRRAAHQLPLNVLAVGNPAAAVANVAVWDGASASAPIARVGPGTGGDSAFARIDPDLEQPITDEFVLRVEGRPVPSVLLYLTRTTKRQDPLLGYLETAIPFEEYSVVQVPDPEYSPEHPLGAPMITAYSRPPASYGRDRYVLTNRDVEGGESWAMEFGAEVSTDRYLLLASGLFSWANGPAAAEGFRPTENDQDVLGSLLVDPNRASYERGQLFVDRSHVAKAAAIVQLPWTMTLGVTARYQDGQPFARVMVVPDLTQGPMAIRALRNGGHAFTYTATLDVRLQKALTIGSARVSAVVDVYNLTGHEREVEEDIVMGPGFRTPTALQPPFTMVVGARVGF
jgi:hypothetical protein